MKYLKDEPFGTGANSKKYRDNFDKVFGKKPKGVKLAAVFKEARKRLEEQAARRPKQLGPEEDIFQPREDGRVYQCAACGKKSKTRAPSKHSDHGWDESCFLHCVLIEEAAP